MAADGVTENNKRDVCNSVANGLDGTAVYCSLQGPSGGRRILATRDVYIDVLVDDAASAERKASSKRFIQNLEGIPSDVYVSDVSPSVTLI